jgi:hypothetical protein
MVSFFSSPEATAVANFLVLAGLALAIGRIARLWLSKTASRFSKALRKGQQTFILGELSKIRLYRRNKLASIRDAAYGLFDDILSTLTIIGIALCGVFIKLAVDAEGHIDGPDEKIWTSIYADHVYWLSVGTIIFVGITLFLLLLLVGARYQLRFLRYAAEPDEQRAKLISRYLKLRSLR